MSKIKGQNQLICFLISKELSITSLSL